MPKTEQTQLCFLLFFVFFFQFFRKTVCQFFDSQIYFKTNAEKTGMRSVSILQILIQISPENGTNLEDLLPLFAASFFPKELV
jgi:hypothetical protein